MEQRQSVVVDRQIDTVTSIFSIIGYISDGQSNRSACGECEIGGCGPIVVETPQAEEVDIVSSVVDESVPSVEVDILESALAFGESIREIDVEFSDVGSSHKLDASGSSDAAGIDTLFDAEDTFGLVDRSVIFDEVVHFFDESFDREIDFFVFVAVEETDSDLSGVLWFEMSGGSQPYFLFHGVVVVDDDVVELVHDSKVGFERHFG